MNILERKLGGHFDLGNITFFGFNSMHLTITIKTARWGYICFQPPCWMNGRYWPWKFYVSPNGTPWASTFAVGPGIDEAEKVMSRIRRYLFGHNTYPGDDYIEWYREFKGNLEHLHRLNVEAQRD